MNLSRRDLFGAAAAATATSLVGGGSRIAAAAYTPKLNIGLASYSMRKFPVDKVLELCAAANVKFITLKDMHLPMKDAPEALKATMERFKAAGINVTGGGVINMKAGDADGIKKAFQYAKDAGLPMIVGSPDPEAIDIVEANVKEFNIPIAIHNHGPEDKKKYPAPKDVLAHIKKRDKRIGCCMDIGHTLRAGSDPAKTAIECGVRLFDLHVKDLKDSSEKAAGVECGRGVMDFVALFKALQKIKYKGHVALEYEVKADDPIPGIHESLAYLRGVAAGLGV